MPVATPTPIATPIATPGAPSIPSGFTTIEFSNDEITTAALQLDNQLLCDGARLRLSRLPGWSNKHVPGMSGIMPIMLKVVREEEGVPLPPVEEVPRAPKPYLGALPPKLPLPGGHSFGLSGGLYNRVMATYTKFMQLPFLPKMKEDAVWIDRKVGVPEILCLRHPIFHARAPHEAHYGPSTP